MRARIAVLSIIAAVLVLAAGPASALETKPTNPPVPPDGTVVSPPQPPYIESVRYTGGNGDQTPDPGERLQVFFSLRNPTDKALTDVSGTLTLKGDGMTVIDDTATWPDIAAGALEESTTPFVIQISDTEKRATPCSGGLEVPPAPGTVTPVASDVAVPSDGSASSGSGSAPASPGTVEPAGTASAEPGVVEPAPTASSEPPSTESPIEPPADAPVPFDASVSVHTASSSFDAGFGSGLACPLALGAPGTTNTGGTGAKPQPPEMKAFAADASRAAASSTSSSTVPLVLVLAAAALALVARYRFTA